MENTTKEIKDKGQIEIEIDSGKENIVRMTSLISEIEKQLSIILRNPYPVEEYKVKECKDECKKEHIVILASDIRNINDQMLSNIHQIESILERLEL